MKSRRPPESGPWTPPEPISRTTEPADARFSIPGATPTRQRPITEAERDVCGEDPEDQDDSIIDDVTSILLRRPRRF
jgi:hypothetical protein